MGGVAHLLYGFLDFQKKQLFVSTADAEYLTTHGNEFGLVRKTGTKATGSGTATGTTGTVIAASTKLQSATGNVYSTDSEVTLVAGVGTLAITADDVGDAYNEDAGAELTFVSPLATVDTIVTIDANALTGGVDEETDDEYRNRLLTRKRLPPHGGADFDYENWALEVSGVTRAWSIPLYQGAGTIGLAFVRDDDDSIIPTSTQRDDVYNYVLSHTDPITSYTIGIPVTAEPGFFMIPITGLTVNMTIKLSPNTETVQASVKTRLKDLFRTFGGPGETITISQIYEAVVSASGEVTSKIIIPADDVAAATNQVHLLGEITYQDYT